MSIFIAGGAGYIGLHLIKHLLSEGYSVKCFDRFLFGKKYEYELRSHLKLDIIKGDTRTFSPNILDRVSTVIDLAAISQPDNAGLLSSELYEDINYRGALRLATLSKKYGIRGYIFASTCSVYGLQEHVLSENSPLKPYESYGKTKARVERELMKLNSRDFGVTILRFATVYGLSPKMRFDLVVNGMTLSLYKDKIIKVMKNGNQWRPVVHVKDVASAIVTVLENGENDVFGEVYNVGSNEQNYQIYQLANEIGEAIGIPYSIEWYGEPDHRSYRVDFTKIHKELNYKTQFTPAYGALEIYEALCNQSITDTDEAYVINWYKRLQNKNLIDPT